MKLGIEFVWSGLVALVVLGNTDAYPYGRYSRRGGRPLSRLFGSPFPISRSTVSRYDPETGRPASKPFTIPGFSMPFSDPSRQSNMGFDLGFGGSALIDPIAGLYDQPMAVGDLGVIGGIGDLGFGTAAQSRTPISRMGADLQLDPTLFGAQNINLEYVDSGMGQFLPAAGTRNLGSMDMNSALNQPLDISSYASPLNTNVQMTGSPTQTSFSSNQLGDGFSSIIIDGTGLDNGGASQIALSNQELNSLGLGTSNQISLGPGQVQLDGNQVGLGGSQFQTGSTNSLNMNQLGLGSNQVGQTQMGATQLNAGQLQTNQIGLDSLSASGLGGNQVLIDTSQLQLGVSNGEFNADQITLSGNHQILTTGQQSPGMNTIGMGAGQLNDGTNLQGTLGLAEPTSSSMSNTQFLTSSGNIGSNLMSSQSANGNNQFFLPSSQSEQSIIAQSQGTDGMTSQVGSAMISQLNQAQITAGT